MTTTLSLGRALALIPLFIGSTALAQELQLAFSYTDLGMSAPEFDSGAMGVNNRGQVVGWKEFAVEDSATSRPGRGQLWNNGAIDDMVDLGAAYPDSRSAAYDIGNDGTVVGYASFSPYFFYRPMTWKDGAVTWLAGDGRSILDPVATAHAINDTGHVVGRMRATDGQMVPFLWDGQSTQVLEHWNISNGGAAMGINNQGTIVGWNYPNAVVWKQGQRIILPTLLSDPTARWMDARAYDVNDSEVIVGASGARNAVYDPYSRAVVWFRGAVYELNSVFDTPTQKGDAVALAINKSGLIVGVSRRFAWAEATPGRPVNGLATLWVDRHTALDLNIFLPLSVRQAGWILQEALDINDQGWIVGIAYNRHTRQHHAWVMKPLTAMPVPSYPQ